MSCAGVVLAVLREASSVVISPPAGQSGGVITTEQRAPAGPSAPPRALSRGYDPFALFRGYHPCALLLAPPLLPLLLVAAAAHAWWAGWLLVLRAPLLPRAAWC